MRAIIIISVVCIGILSISCSANTTINITKIATDTVAVKGGGNAKGNAKINSDIEINIDIAHFFIEYLQDLLGIDGIKGLVKKFELEDFLAEYPNITELQIKTTSKKNAIKLDTDSIIISFHTSDLLDTLYNLNIPYMLEYKKSDVIISMKISREFIITMLNNFPDMVENNITDFLLPNKETVPESKFADYISWSFNEYENEKKIIGALNESQINFTITSPSTSKATKPATVQSVPVQAISLILVPLLYTNTQTLKFSIKE